MSSQSMPPATPAPQGAPETGRAACRGTGAPAAHFRAGEAYVGDVAGRAKADRQLLRRQLAQGDGQRRQRVAAHKEVLEAAAVAGGQRAARPGVRARTRVGRRARAVVELGRHTGSTWQRGTPVATRTVMARGGGGGPQCAHAAVAARRAAWSRKGQGPAGPHGHKAARPHGRTATRAARSPEAVGQVDEAVAVHV